MRSTYEEFYVLFDVFIYMLDYQLEYYTSKYNLLQLFLLLVFKFAYKLD